MPRASNLNLRHGTHGPGKKAIGTQKKQCCATLCRLLACEGLARENTCRQNAGRTIIIATQADCAYILTTPALRASVHGSLKS